MQFRVHKIASCFTDKPEVGRSADGVCIMRNQGIMPVVLIIAQVFHGHIFDGLLDFSEEHDHIALYAFRYIFMDKIKPELRKSAPAFVVIDHLVKLPSKGNGFAAFQFRGLTVFLGNKNFGGKDWVVVEQPVVDKKPERVGNPAIPGFVFMRTLIHHTLHHPPQQCVLVGGVFAVFCQDSREDLCIQCSRGFEVINRSFNIEDLGIG